MHLGGALRVEHSAPPATRVVTHTARLNHMRGHMEERLGGFVVTLMAVHAVIVYSSNSSLFDPKR